MEPSWKSHAIELSLFLCKHMESINQSINQYRLLHRSQKIKLHVQYKNDKYININDKYMNIIE